MKTSPDWNEDEPKPEGETPEDGMRQTPTEPPAVVPAISSDQLGIAAGIGLAGFAKQNPDGGFSGDADEPWQKTDPEGSTQPTMDDVAP